MSREILFRGKTVNGNDWVKSMTIANGTIKRKAYDIFMEISENKWVGIQKNTLSQFTGVIDKNGIEIYEGDISRVGKYIGVVGFSYGCYNISGWAISFRIEKTEVIGNIHDNPELLESVS